MVTKAVIKELYKKFKEPPEDVGILNLSYFMELLKEHHPMRIDGGEIVVENVDEYSPFRRMLIKRLTGVMEFNKYVAFVMQEHILFFEKRGKGILLHLIPTKKKSCIKKIFNCFGIKKD